MKEAREAETSAKRIARLRYGKNRWAHVNSYGFLQKLCEFMSYFNDAES
jgi:hypothetical protein